MTVVQNGTAPPDVVPHVVVPHVVVPQPGAPTPSRDPQDRAPLAEAVHEYVAHGTVSFHCPAHKSGTAADPHLRRLAGPELLANDVWLGTTTFDRARREAEDLAARLWGTDRAFLLGNGSSSGNQALLLATLRPGDEVIVARDAHVSVHSALVMTGASPVWVQPKLTADGMLPTGLGVQDVLAALVAHPAARMLVLVRPTYAGGCGDLRPIVAAAHARGVAVVVDEAWGAHLRFHPDLPEDALSAGADAVVTSTHKMGGSVSQSALLLVRGDRIDLDAVDAAVRMVSTTSPLLPMLASIDVARRRLALAGRADLTKALAAADLLRSRLAMLPGVRVLSAGTRGATDPLKIIVDVSGRGITGVAAERELRAEHDIAPEGSDGRNLVFVVSSSDDPDSVAQLVAALAQLPLRRPAMVAPLPFPGEPAAQVMTPRSAWFARSEPVRLADAPGRVAAELVTPYPPGIPALVPGESVTPGQVRALVEAVAAGVHIHGARDPSLRTIRVVATS